jgi:steryl-sulfatase|eukprot:g7806.t1
MLPWLGKALALLSTVVAAVTAASSTPNVIVFLVDDLGYGDLGIQGNNSYKTPNIDRIGKEGVRFTHWLSGSAICTPSRAALLTGRLPQRFGMANSHHNARVMSPTAPGGLPHSEITLAERLRDSGYRTHMTGKWHLGIGKDGAFLPPSHGFDEYYGFGVTNVQTCDPNKTIFIQSSLVQFYWSKTSHVWPPMVFAFFATVYAFGGSRMHYVLSAALVLLSFYSGYYYTATYTLLNRDMCLLYRNYDIVQQPANLQNMTQRLTADATRYIHSSVASKDQKPFFLFMSYLKVHTALFNNEEFQGTGGDAGEYGDNVVELDWSIGEILNTLDDLNVASNTVVWFTSDNGPFLERGLEGGGSGFVLMPDGKKEWLRGGKGQQWEGGVRVPGLMRWPDGASSGTVVDVAVSTMDIFPTTLGIVERTLAGEGGRKNRLYDSRGLDGKDISPLLTNKKGADGLPMGIPQHLLDARFFAHYCGTELHAVRLGNRYKMHWTTPNTEEGINSCPKESICGCTGSLVSHHNPPLLFDLQKDPSESVLLTPENFPSYHAISEKIHATVEKHKSSMPDQFTIENQLDIFSPKNFLTQVYPCCNPPTCKCDKDV